VALAKVPRAADGPRVRDNVSGATANALAVAETRAKKYRAKHQEQTGQDPRYLAVLSYTISSDEIPELYAKLLHSPGANSRDLEDLENNKELDMYCVNIFDTRTQNLVNPQGYAILDLPRRGSIAQFGTYTARYIGRGG
jgi:hypothetical protein